ncbi:MAG: CRISPR-associated endonuclease Cas1 [Desulfomonilia bacterium]
MNGHEKDYPDLVPARMVNEFVYCPRLAYIEWVQGDFAHNYETMEGRFKHRRIDQEKGDLPDEINERDFIHARSVMLSSPDDHLIARIDLVEGEKGEVTPVDYKRGAVPDNPDRSWDADRVQICAQGLVLKANGYNCNAGIIYYTQSKTRVPVMFDPELTARTREAVAGIRKMAQSGIIPDPLENNPKCFRCSLAGVCLPDETNMLAGRTEGGQENVRRILPARDDAMPLYVQVQGANIRKRGEIFEVWVKDEKVGESRIFETSHVAVFGNVQVSTQALQEMCVRGIPLTFFSTGGWYYGNAHGMTHKNVELRLFQYKAHSDPRKCLALAREMIAAKIENCRTMLMRNHVDLPEHIPVEMKQWADSAREAKDVASLLGMEGMAARTYFSMFSGMIKARENDLWAFDFNGRNRRPPLDPVNAMLSYAYSLLVKDITVILQAIGFDPYLGFYHAIRYGRPSLALDLMEEFRPIIADSVVLWVVNNRVLGPEDFIRRGRGVSLTNTARRKFIQSYERRLDTLVTHPVFGYKISYRRVLEVQGRLLGRFLSGEIGDYHSFRTR